MPTKLDAADGARDESGADSLVSIRDLEVHFQLRGGALSRLLGLATGTVKAVDGITLDLHKGEVLGLVGESGSGKTTLGRALLGLVDATSGSIEYGGTDLTRLSSRQLRELRRDLQMVFQDPHAALNPSMTIESAVGHPLRIHGLAAGEELRRRVVEALERVGLSPVERFLSKYPADLSGGQKQRAVLARAIILNPVLLVADEPVSMLDMSVRAKILELMLYLKNELELTYVYITHDLATAKFFCDRVAIMYLGRVVEVGSTQEIFADPKHPYTRSLLQAIPEPDPDKALPRELPRGEIPDAASPPAGCAFHPRCPEAFDNCGWEQRDLKALIEAHWIRREELDYESERGMIANLEELDAPGHQAVVKAGGSRSAVEVEALLEKVKAEDPDEPLWRGVEDTQLVDGGVQVRFYPGEDPRLRRAGNVDVACHLYPES